MEVQLTSTLTCPQCSDRTTRTMPQDACVIVAHCTACDATMRPRLGDCCVFCSYGNVPCPPIQRERAAA